MKPENFYINSINSFKEKGDKKSKRKEVNDK